MSVSKIFKRVLIPCAAGVTNKDALEPKCGDNDEPGVKPSALPIYSKKCTECVPPKVVSSPPSSMEETVGNIRRELWVWQDNLRGYRHKVVDVYRQGFAKADSAVEYLREETHGPQRLGAIALSGLAGYILGMRRGRFRRVMYALTGATGMAAVCYPTETVDCLESVVLEARRYFIVAYHFIYGETPKMPGWLEKLTGDMGLAVSKSTENKTRPVEDLRRTPFGSKQPGRKFRGENGHRSDREKERIAEFSWKN
ncbi:hypothetical protein RUM44_004000 [Polyplax serrata]|uniref:MICOS complex subunit n=1 Tax=Polyplax serrata TaxID=468196 RepID=A0ABR1B1K5_POLSC